MTYTCQQLRELKGKKTEDGVSKVIKEAADAIKRDIYKSAVSGDKQFQSFMYSKFTFQILALVKEMYPDIKYTINDDRERLITRIVFDWS